MSGKQGTCSESSAGLSLHRLPSSQEACAKTVSFDNDLHDKNYIIHFAIEVFLDNSGRKRDFFNIKFNFKHRIQT